jgi:hypothetical protein
VQMKDRLTVFHLHLESRAVRKIRLRYTESELHLSVYHMSQISGDPLSSILSQGECAALAIAARSCGSITASIYFKISITAHRIILVVLVRYYVRTH